MNKVAFSIDEARHRLKVLFVKNKAFGYKEFMYSPELTTPEKIIMDTLPTFVSEENIYPATATYVIADKYVFFDYIELPAVSKQRSVEMLSLEISTRLKQPGNYKTLFVPMGKVGGKSPFSVMFIDNAHIASVQNALKGFKFSEKRISFESAMVANAFFNLVPINKNFVLTSKHNSFLFGDIKENETKIAFVKDNHLVFFSSLPYGKDLCELDGSVKVAPPVLTAAPLLEKHKVVFNYVPDEPNKGNVKFLVRTLEQMCDIAKNRYHLPEPSVKINVSSTCAMLFAPYKDVDRINTKNPLVAKYLELYGALAPKTYDRGLIF